MSDVSEDASDEVLEGNYNAKVTEVEIIIDADEVVEVNSSAKVTEIKENLHY